MSGGRGPKTKGSTFEILCCHMLSLWVSNGTRDDLFWRAAMSGGRATVRHARGRGAQKVSGDICAVHPLGHQLTDYYHLECKHVASLDLTAAMLRGNGALVRYWDKCAKQAKQHGKFPMLIARQNRYQEVIVLPLGHGIFEGPSMVLPTHRCVVYQFAQVMTRAYVVPRLPIVMRAAE